MKTYKLGQIVKLPAIPSEELPAQRAKVIKLPRKLTGSGRRVIVVEILPPHDEIDPVLEIRLKADGTFDADSMLTDMWDQDPCGDRW